MHLIGESEINAEMSVLGAVFLNPDVLDEIGFLEERDFALPRNRDIYKVMRFLERKGKPIDIITVTETFAKFGRIENIGGVSYLSDLAEACPTAANAEFYARAIRSKAMERRIKNTADIIQGMSRDDYDSDEEFFSYVENLITELRPKDTAKMKSFTETKDNYMNHLQTPTDYIKTGFQQFDNWAKGLGRGWLYVSAGRPSVGKTAKMLQRLYGVAKQHKGVVLIFSQEMSENELKDRMMSSITGIPYGRILSKQLSESEKDQLAIAYEGFEYLPIYIQDSAKVSIDEVRATAKQFKKKYGKIAVIAVDYLQIMHIPKQKGESRAEAIGNVTGEAKRIAREMDCCFMMLSQMSRESEKRGASSKPLLSDLKESGSIEQDADVVEFLWHDPNDWDSQGKVIQQTIAKGRSIGLNEFRLLFQGWKQKFVELPKGGGK